MVEIENKIDELTIERYGFIFLDKQIYLDSYLILKKETTRSRKYNVTDIYKRIDGRRNTLKEEDINISEELKQYVLNEFTKNIKVLKWSERVR
jgi:hypothetical protein